MNFLTDATYILERLYSPEIRFLLSSSDGGKGLRFSKYLHDGYLFMLRGKSCSAQVRYWIIIFCKSLIIPYGLYKQCSDRKFFFLLLFFTLNHMWHFSDKGPFTVGSCNVILLRLTHYRCLSFICYCQGSGWKWTGSEKLSAAEFPSKYS